MCARNTAAQEQDDDLHRAQEKATRRKRKEKCEPKKTRQTRGKDC